jgi:hypothetical protein
MVFEELLDWGSEEKEQKIEEDFLEEDDDLEEDEECDDDCDCDGSCSGCGK